jgi:hypothetical protein
MSLEIVEAFGYHPGDRSEVAQAQRRSEECPFLHKQCWKKFRAGGRISGTCTVKPPQSEEVIVCPDRLYAEDFRILRDVAGDAFGEEFRLIGPSDIAGTQGEQNRVVVFGKRWGKELRVPKSDADGKSYSADWILARITDSGKVEEFVPVEVQSMDTTGSYQRVWYELFGLQLPEGCDPTNPSINWENVNKRIIPQLLTKGNVFGNEPLCKKGLYFICPAPVYQRLIMRLGAKLSKRPKQPTALTFRWYKLADKFTEGAIRKLEFADQFTTTIENLKEAFNSTLNLPSMGAMAEKIQEALDKALKGKKR